MGVGQLWQYPLSRPSARFNQFNNFVRSLDVRYHKLGADKRRGWEDFIEEFFSAGLCIDDIFDFDPDADYQVAGLQGYRAINTMRLVQGLGVTDDAPLVATVPAGDTINVEGFEPLSVTWGGRPDIPPGEFVACVWALPLNHAPESGPRPSRCKWCFSAPISYGFPFSCAPIFDAHPGWDSMPAVGVVVAIADTSGSMFAASSVSFESPYF